MSNSLSVFEANRPSYLTGYDNQELAAYTSDSYAMLSIKGKVFAYAKGDKRVIIPRERGSRDPASRINVIILRAGIRPAKRYYEGVFKEGDENQKPVCFSFDGMKPDSSSTTPQCKTCAACRNNAFGTARNQDGTMGKGKACADYVRLAVVFEDKALRQEVLYLAVPAASIKNFNAFVTLVVRNKMPLHGVVTEISFDPAAATPKLCFEAIDLIRSEAEFNELTEMRDMPVVHNIVEGAARVDPTEGAIEERPVTFVTKPQEPTPGTVESAKAEVVDSLLETAFNGVKTAEASSQPSEPAPAPAKKEAPKKAAEPIVAETEDGLAEALKGFGF